MSFKTEIPRRGRFSALGKALPVLALMAGFGLSSGAALAQHSGGGGGGGHGGGGGGGGFHGGGGGGGFHGGGGWHGGGGGWHGGGGGWHGGGWHGGGWHGGGWGWRGGWGGWGWGPGWGWGGYYGGIGYDPYWGGDYYGGLASAPLYPQPDDDQGDYGPQNYGPQNYGPQNYGPQNYAPTADGMVDNSRGFYRWQVGVENGSCNRPFLGQVVNSVNGATTASFQPGQRLGGISVAPVIGGKVGARLDVTDQACATEALERTNTGTPVRWQTASGIPVTFTVTKTSEAGGRRCRDFTAAATFASQAQTVKGYACKEADGSWQTMR